MSYTDEGYVKKTEAEIIREKEEQFKNLFSIINYSISDVMWQWLKLSVYERVEVESLNEIATEQMSITTAQGVFLDKFGIECGIERKDATKSEGYVDVTADIQSSSITIIANSRFSSPTNVYKVDENTTIPYQVEMTKTKTGESDDFFPSQISSVETIVKIVDSNNNPIDPAYWDLDPIYKNNVQWTEGSSAVIIKNETYIATIKNDVVYRIEVASESEGESSYAPIDTVVVSLDYPSLACTNSEEIEGGKAQEDDEDYRARLLAARRRTFTLVNVKSIVDEIQGVRASKVFNCVGTDQSSIADWDNPSRGADLALSGTVAMYSQSFVPGDQIATLGKIVLYGRPVNDPPAIYCGIKPDIDSIASGIYYDYISVQKYELDQSVTGFKDIEFNVKWNGMDKTKTYRFDVWCEDPENPSYDWSTNHWLLATSTEDYRGDERGMLYNRVGNGWEATGDSLDMFFKSRFNGAGFNVIVATEDGYGFENIEPQIENYLDFVENGGYSPVCIQSVITEAEEILIDITAVLYISELADFQNVRREVAQNIETYLENLQVGANVVYSRVYQTIMNHEQVDKIEDLYMKRADLEEWVQIDIGILEEEIPDLGSRTFQSG
ncbi:MAG: baseplate J/gp47 family protein [Saprospiraceae bacterium]